MSDVTSATVIVVTYNSRRHLPALFGSIHAGMSGVQRFNLIVVDNASSDGTTELVRAQWPFADVLEMDCNRGYAAGINAGLREADPDEPVLVLNPDVELQAGCGAQLLAEVRPGGAGIAVPRLVDTSGRTSLSIRREPSVIRVWAEAVLGGTLAARLGLSEVAANPRTYSTPGDVDWATGAVMAISPEVRRAIGGWDESFFLYSEEVDYCRRARAAGFTIRYLPAAVARHVSGEYGSNAELWRTLVRNRARDYRRHHGRLRSRAFSLGLATGELVRAPVSRARVPAARAIFGDVDPGRVGTGNHHTAHNQGIIWFAAQDWWHHNQAHSDFQLMREVARDQKVLVVNSLGLRVPRRGQTTAPGRRIMRKVRSTLKLVRRPLDDNPHFHVMTPVILPFFGDRLAARVSAWLIRQQVTAVARSIGIGPRCTVGVTIPSAWPVVSHMSRSALLFNRADLHSAFPESDGWWVAQLEASLLRHSDRVLYVSHELMATDSSVVGDRGYFLDHGVDVDHFHPGGQSEEHPLLANIEHPRIGFFGGFDDYVVDLDLLRATALELPDVNVVLIGDATCPMDRLTELPNVHWFGFQPYDQIPSFGRGFDVGLMPWLDNEWIRYANPIKLKEYLALGLPVVTTSYPEAEYYRDLIWIAEDSDDFVRCVRAALASPGDAVARRAAVLSSSWRARAQVISEVAASAGGM